MDSFFVEDKRLGIMLPHLDQEWHEYNKETQHKILGEWENIRGQIPDRIKDLEEIINIKQAQLNTEENFVISCKLNFEISELASIINDLWIWFRTSQKVSGKVHN